MAFYEYEPSEDGKGYYFRFEYDQDLVTAIKQVPYSARRWDAEEKEWYVDRSWFKDACRFLDHAVRQNTGRPGPHGRERKASREERDAGAAWDDWKQDPWGQRNQAQSQSRTDPLSQAYSALHLTKDAPLPVVEAVYRTLAKIHHPDLGGDVERMKEINLAYEKVKVVASKQ